MSATTIQQMADRVAALMEERLGATGTGLAVKLKKVGRTLPRAVRDAAGRLAQAAEMAQNPKLLVQVDEERVAADYDACLRHLSGVSVWGRRGGLLGNFAASVAMTLIVVGVLVAGVLYWRGLV